MPEKPPSPPPDGLVDPFGNFESLRVNTLFSTVIQPFDFRKSYFLSWHVSQLFLLLPQMQAYLYAKHRSNAQQDTPANPPDDPGWVSKGMEVILTKSVSKRCLLVVHIYDPQTKLRESNVFTSVCQSSTGECVMNASRRYASYWHAFFFQLGSIPVMR